MSLFDMLKNELKSVVQETTKDAERKIVKAGIQILESSLEESEKEDLTKVVETAKLMVEIKNIPYKLQDKVKPVPGSIVFCDLVGAVEHSGVYVGDNKIVHLDGSGKIEIVSPQVFKKRLSGVNYSEFIIVSSSNGKAVGGKKIVKRALDMVGKKKKYNLFFENCHQFTSTCITGNIENNDCYLWKLKKTAIEHLHCNEWRAWDISFQKELK